MQLEVERQTPQEITKGQERDSRKKPRKAHREMEKEKSKYKTGARDILKICLLVDLSSSPLSPQQSRFLQLWADSQRFPPDPSDGTCQRKERETWMCQPGRKNAAFHCVEGLRGNTNLLLYY